MNGIDVARPEFVWAELAHRIQEEDHPTDRELATTLERALRAAGAPESVSAYVASRVRGESMERSGRPVDPWRGWARVLRRHIDVSLREAAFRKFLSIKNPRTRALEVTARDEGLSVDALRKDLKNGLKPGPTREGQRITRRVRQAMQGPPPSLCPELIPPKSGDWSAEAGRAAWKQRMAEHLDEMLEAGEVRLDEEVGFVLSSSDSV